MLNEAIKTWPEWGLSEKPILIREFDHGKNHHTGLIKSGDRQLVLKVFDHSFSRTIQAEYWASEHAVSPKLRMAANNIALYEFIENQGFSESEIDGLAITLKRTHQNKEHLGPEFKLLEYCEQYLSTANDKAHLWHQTLMPALLFLCKDPTPKTFCHNDLVQQNCLFNNGRVTFIDWEFAQTNNPWFDLASIIHYFDLNLSQARVLLAAYEPDWQHKAGDTLFYSSQIAVLWCDLLWHMHQFGNDYAKKNKHRFEQLIQLALEVDISLRDSG